MCVSPEGAATCSPFVLLRFTFCRKLYKCRRVTTAVTTALRDNEKWISKPLAQVRRSFPDLCSNLERSPAPSGSSLGHPRVGMLTASRDGETPAMYPPISRGLSARARCVCDVIDNSLRAASRASVASSVRPSVSASVNPSGGYKKATTGVLRGLRELKCGLAARVWRGSIKIH